VSCLLFQISGVVYHIKMIFKCVCVCVCVCVMYLSLKVKTCVSVCNTDEFLVLLFMLFDLYIRNLTFFDS
jgi:hypothetical protein